METSIGRYVATAIANGDFIKVGPSSYLTDNTTTIVKVFSDDKKFDEDSQTILNIWEGYGITQSKFSIPYPKPLMAMKINAKEKQELESVLPLHRPIVAILARSLANAKVNDKRWSQAMIK